MKDLLRASRVRTSMNRRLFLKALGLGLSLPLVHRLLQSASAAPAGVPKRFLLFYMPHGVPTEHFRPLVNADGSFTLADSGVSVLGPLEPYKNLVNIYQGFNYPGASTHEGIVKFLSNYSGSNSDDSSTRTSIEHYIGNELNSPTLALGALPHRRWGIDFDGKLMWDAQPVVPENNPLAAFDSIYGNFSSAPTNDASVQDDLFQALLTLNEAEISSLSKELTGLSKQQSKLQIHLESIQSLRASGTGKNLSCAAVPEIAAVESLRTSAQGKPPEWFLDENNFEPILQAQLQLAASALICNARPVVALQSLYANCEINFGFAKASLGLTGSENLARGHHNGLSHSSFQIQNGMADMNVRADFAWAQRYFVQNLVDHVIEPLGVDDPAAPGSTVLDNTTILVCSEVGDGANHTSATSDILNGPPPGLTSHLALTTIGGCGGALKTGQVLNYNDGEGSDRPAGDLWLTLAQAMGVSTTEFGGATNVVQEALA